MKRMFVLFMGFVLTADVVSAQGVKRQESYNYNRGLEAVIRGEFEEAAEYLNKELTDNPDNGYALFWIANIRNQQNDYGRALRAVDLAIKKIPRKAKEYKACAYIVRADVYMALGNKGKAIDDLTSAIDENPDDPSAYLKRAALYFSMAENGLACGDYQAAISINPGVAESYVGLGMICNAEKRYEDAIKQLDYAVKLAPNDSRGYSAKAESYIGLRKYGEAIDDIIRALDIDYDYNAFMLMRQVADSAMMPLVVKLEVKAANDPNNGYWPYCLGIVHEINGAYKKAIGYYESSIEKEMLPSVDYRISYCYSKLGDFASALEYVGRAIAEDSTEYGYVMWKAEILYDSGDIKGAIMEADKCANLYPGYYGTYYRRGWFKDNSGDVDGAIEDYTKSIILNPSYAYAYLGRADMFLIKGDTAAAMADYRKVIKTDTVPGRNSCAQYAYLRIGEKEKSVDFMERIIESNSSDAGSYYDAACLYAMMGDGERAVGFQRTALEKGFRRFAHIEMDDDLDGIRQMPAFKDLLRQYKEKVESEAGNARLDGDVYESQSAEILFPEKAGCAR